MKPAFKLISSTLVMCSLWSCNTISPNLSEENSIDTLEHELIFIDTLLEDNQGDIQTEEEYGEEESDSPYIWLSADLFNDISIVQKNISENQFQRHVENYTISCEIDTTEEMIPTHLIKGKGLEMYYYSDPPACSSGIIDKKTGKNMMLASRYDDGFVVLRLSPSCKQFITFFQFLPYYEYEDEYGAELFGYTLSQGSGIESITPSFKYYTKDWLINELVWINENTIAVQIYKETIYLMDMDSYPDYEYLEIKLGGK